MLKIKLFAIAAVLMLTGFILSSSTKFSATAKGDVVEEIAGYKSWSKITKEPITVQFTLDNLSGGG